MARNLTAVAEDLKRLAPGRSTGERALRDLAAQMERSNGAALADVDLVAVYPPALMIPEGASWRRRLLTGLELARDVLIFVPVIYTWWKISIALEAYETYDGDEAFLLAWQHGFGGRAEPLSTSALVVSGVVLGIVVLTFVAHLARAWHERHAQQRQRTLAVLLAEANLLLSQSLLGQDPQATRRELIATANKIAESTKSLESTLSKVVKDIAKAVDASPGSELHKMFAAWIAAADALRELGKRLSGSDEMLEKLGDAHEATASLADQIRDETTRLVAAFVEERVVSLQEAHAHHEVAVEVGQSTRALGASLDTMSSQTESINELVLRMVHVVDRLESDNGHGPPDGYER